MIETRLKQIFDYLTSDYDYHTSMEIGEIMELSSKTIRKEINLLNSKIKDKGAIIESKTGKGYLFKILDEKKFKNFLKNDWYKYAYFQEESGDKELRYENILRMFLFSSSYIKQHELAENFHVSESQINKDLPIIRDTLKDYNLELVSKPYYGMRIEGSEKNIRLAIKNEIGEDPSLFDDDENKVLFNKIQDIVDELDFGEDYYMPYVNFKNLVIHIYISILRIRQKKYIKLSKEMEKKVVSYEEFKIANKIVKELQDKLEITIPKEELVYITMHLIAKNIVKDQEKISSDILKLSQDIIDEIYKVTKYDFRENIELYFALAIHLGPLINRIKYGFNMKNPILSDIKENKISFIIASVGANVINNKYRTRLSEDEIGYIALHIMAAIESSSNKNKNILIVCGSGNSSAQIMKAQLKKQFEKNIEKITITDLRNLKRYKLDNYDFIISSVDLDINTKTPIVYVDILFTKNDLYNIKNAFKKDNLDCIYKIFKKSVLINDSNIKTKDQVLLKIAKIIKLKSGIDIDKSLGQMIQREEMGATEYEKMIAIPHILQTTKADTFLIIISLDSPIIWDRLEVKLIVSLVLNEKAKDLNIFYDYLGRFLDNERAIDRASKIDNIKEFMEIFIDKEQ